MKKFSMVFLAATFLFGLTISGRAQSDPPGKGRAPTVGVRMSDDDNAPMRFMRLEYKLSLLAFYNPGEMKIHSVEAGGPASRLIEVKSGKSMTLEPGDVITHVNGRRINSQDDYYRAMYLAGARNGKVKLTVKDANSGETVEFTGVAEKVSGGRGRAVPLGSSKRATKVKVLLIGATSDKAIGDGAAANLDAWQEYVTGLPNFNAKTDLIVLKAQNVSPGKIMQTVENMDVGPTETLLCYIACHGGSDEELAAGDPAGGHLFQLSGGDLMRRSLLEALTGCGGQLTVLITDTCNAPTRTVFVPPTVNAMPPKAIESKVLTELLYGYEGVIDVSGTSKGQYGWYYQDGGWFTTSLTGRNGTLAKLEGQTGVDWKKFLDKTATDASDLFHARKKALLSKPLPTDATDADRDIRKKLEVQDDQRPQVFQMAVKPVQK